VADFATSFTLSIALPVRLLGAAGLDGSTAATLPAPVVAAWGFPASDLAASDLALSDSAAAWWAVGCWAICAYTGDTNAGVNSTVAAMANAASDADEQKGQ
jgi:hypothetical protein